MAAAMTAAATMEAVFSSLCSVAVDLRVPALVAVGIGVSSWPFVFLVSGRLSTVTVSVFGWSWVLDLRVLPVTSSKTRVCG